MIVAVPIATAVTKPVELTVAVVASDVVQVMVWPVSVAPFASSVVAVSCWVPPTASDGEDGDTVTEATGTARTVIDCCPCLPPADAMTTVWPGATPVTTPAVVMLATDAELVDQVTAPTAMGAPF